MRSIFSKTSFPLAPGGNGYEWKKAEMKFNVSKSGLFAIKIEASAKNAQQNHSKDDDDLRIALDGFDFGKYERHQEMISWKGFGTSASWDGASLKGGIKTIYFFVEFEPGTHTLQFFADETPTLKSIEVFEIQDNTFELKNLKPSENIKSARKGIPWLSFVFLGTQTKIFTLAVNAKSSKRKSNTDGDNLKVVVNGNIQQNPHVPESYKYKNFYFSGDIKEFDIFSITSDKLAEPLAFENAIELWYDEKPEISNLRIEYFDNEEFVERLRNLVNLRAYVFNRAHVALAYFKGTRISYAAQFLKHSLNSHPSNIIFEANNSIARKIKIDPIYEKIIKKLKEKLIKGIFDGEIWPDDFKDALETNGEIKFNSFDLEYALHGIHKIEYRARPVGKNKFFVDITFFDVYDFEKQTVPFFLADKRKYVKNIIINALNMGEDLGLVHNFEIEIRLKETLNVDPPLHH